MSATASLADVSTASDPAHSIAVAAHEIRTPLGGVLALADLLLAEDLSDAARGHASALKSAAEHLFEVATSLLGGARPKPGVMDVEAFLGRVAPPLAARAAAKGLTFRVTRGPGVPDRIVADEGALRQIVENLGDNALRATQDGLIELAIEREEGDSGSVTLRLAMRDTGPGLGPDPEALFAPYVQGAGPTGAAGLGLALVARMAERMEGRATAFNRPTGGAEVGVVVRFGAVGRMAARSAPGKVLVAEDHPINRRVLATLLDHFGLAYDMVDDGAAALVRVASGAYDLVLMDAVMPRLDGLAATRAIRALEGPERSIRIVGVTARAFDEEIAAFLRAGADAVVTKPLSVAELWRAIGVDEQPRKAG
jgi:CheY-like chemotaxis protein